MVRTSPDKAAAQTGPPNESASRGVCGRLQREHPTSENGEYEKEHDHRSDSFRYLLAALQDLFDRDRQVTDTPARGVVHSIGNGRGN
jgi:hypothetical protein